MVVSKIKLKYRKRNYDRNYDITVYKLIHFTVTRNYTYSMEKLLL